MGRRSQKGKQKKRDSKKKGSFWDNEYANKENINISDNPSSDLEKFFRWLERKDKYYLPQKRISSVLDLGCGNGRNLIYTCNRYKCRGLGYDISSEAIKQAIKKTEECKCNIEFLCRTVDDTIPASDESQKLVFDMMVSHFLPKKRRYELMREIDRVLEPGGFLFLKTFLLDGDINAKRLIREYPGKESGNYIHPKIGVEEHVFTQNEIEEDVSEFFTIFKIYKSHKHLNKKGGANRRRSIVIYAQKSDY